MRYSVSLVLVFVVTLALALALTYTGLWPLTVLAGLVAALAFAREYGWSSLASFLGGLTSSALFIEANYAAFGAPALREAYLAAAVAGVPGFTFIAVTLLLTGVYCVIGNVIGVYIRKLL